MYYTTIAHNDLYLIKGNFMDINAKHPTPQFQNIMLLDLPVEVLENIDGKCDSNSIRQLYTTCRQLRSPHSPTSASLHRKDFQQARTWFNDTQAHSVIILSPHIALLGIAAPKEAHWPGRLSSHGEPTPHDGSACINEISCRGREEMKAIKAASG